jgi:prepilin-type N-terminal cleavage/methylation domain-containing protein
MWTLARTIFRKTRTRTGVPRALVRPSSVETAASSAPQRGTRQRALRGARSGMTLIEVLMALTILAGAMLSIAAYMSKFAAAIARSDVKATANEIAADQIETIKSAPRYQAIDSMYAGTVVMTGTYAGYTRKTLVTRTGGAAADFYDYRTITVVVSNSRLPTPVKKTDIIAAY